MLRLVPFAASTLFGVVLLELLMRAWLSFGPTPPDSTYLADARCGYRLRPDAPAAKAAHPDDYVNDLGFRDADHSRQKSPGTWRVLGLGDSFVYGMVAPADNFLRVAARRLAAFPPPIRRDPRW